MVNQRPVIEPWFGKNIEDRPSRACLWITRCEYDARHTRKHNRASAHCTWLKGHIEDCVQQPPVANPPGRFAQGKNLRVSGRVARQLALIAANTDHLTLMDDNRSDRHITSF